MKMRKLLAVVLAVTLAISAMALSAFATEYETIKIPLTNGTSYSYSATMTWTVPAYAIFGYLNNGDQLEVILPTNLAAYGSFAAYDIAYTLTVNGVTVSLKGVDASTDVSPIYVDGTDTTTYTTDVNAALTDANGYVYWLGYNYSVYTQYVDVGYFARNYGTVGNAQIPQSTLVSENTPVTITATVTAQSTSYLDACNDVISYVDADSLLGVSGYGAYSGWMPGAFDAWVSDNANVTAMLVDTTVDTDGDGFFADEVIIDDSTDYTVRVANYDSSNYGSSMKITYTPVDGSTPSTINAKDIVDFGSVTKDDASSSSASTVTIISDTTGTDVTGSALYWDHTLANRAIVATAAATEGATAQVVIDLSTYGTGYVSGLAVYTLYANVDSTSLDNSNSTLWYSSASSLGFYNKVAGTYVLNGSTDKLTFDVDPSLLYNTTYGIYNGTFYVHQLVTATISSSDVYTNKNWWDSGAALKVSADGGAYLLINMPVDETTVDTEQPVEEGETETEDDGEDLSVVDEEPAAETNPTTGIVLALVPMAVAAAAAVASKRR
ncbi:MAG: hypothetical protein LUG86_01035 [Oscillospiraceae bacterium]|nr:hypothetical protein [Oscillospiraceae bacterium]